jgi:DNA invertase Pin-like site-specific DNA recombinase
MGSIYGYARVSTDKQSLGRQLKALADYGIKQEDIFVDKLTGKRYDREGFQSLCEVLQSGDRVVVSELNRIGRTSRELLDILEDWESKGIVFISLKENIDLSTPTGKLITQLLTCLAEFEASCTRERVLQGLEVARANGRVGGRPRIDPEKLNKAIKLYNSKAYTVREVCEIVGISTASLYRALRGGEKNDESCTVL